jgi:uridine phosphorylase
MKKTYPILDFDSERSAILDPHDVIARNDEMPERCVVCFFQNVIDDLVARNQVALITCFRSEMGQHPIYLIRDTEPRIAIFQPGIGAPLTAALFEEVIALGGRKFIACGTTGVLESSITSGELLVPIEAVRDEGTSYHYLPPGEEVHPSFEALNAIETVLRDAGVGFKKVKTWTTDAFYRSTRGKVEQRKKLGCSCVDMEAAALFAVAAFRGVQLGQVLLSADDASGENWDPRDMLGMKRERERVVQLSIEACKLI